MEKSLFEQIGGTYTQVGYYLLPDVELPEEKPIGIWGSQHYHHLRKTNRILFSQLVISGKMNDYLAAIIFLTVLVLLLIINRRSSRLNKEQ